MAEIVSRILLYFSLLLGLLTWPSTARAHRLDEYLQATLVTIAPGELRLQINLTPGVDVAEKVLALIDRNHDGTISTNEATAYAELVKRDLLLRVDERKVAVKLTASNFPSPTELHTGWGIIQMEFSASIGRLATGPHRLILKNRHLPASSVYLFNAAQPTSGLVHITRQKRNETQSTGEIEFTIAGQGTSSRMIAPLQVDLPLTLSLSPSDGERVAFRPGEGIGKAF
jgi:hypothetical protein